MEILINTIPLLSPMTGVGKYTLYLSRTLKEIDRENIYIYFYGYYSQNLTVSNSRVSFFLQAIKEIIKKIPFLADYIRGGLSAFSNKVFDIYFEPNFILLERVKAKKRIVSVFDFSFELYPQWHPEERIKYFRKNFWKSIKKADRVVVPSNFIYNQAINQYGLEKKLLRVVYPGVDHEVFRECSAETTDIDINKYSLPENFILFVGSIEPRKNLKNLLLAYQSLPDYIKEKFKLVLVGFSGWKNREIMEILKKHKDNIIYKGYVSERELAYIYNRASLFVFPSFYEGFGLPPLEAMACGCPVLVSNRASLPEVCGDAAVYCEPDEPESIAEAMYKVLEDEELRKSLIIKGKERAKFFRWDKTAREILNIFEEVAVG